MVDSEGSNPSGTTMEKKMVISFDFDDTLAEDITYGAYGGQVTIAILAYVDLLKEYNALGCDCIILTARTPTIQNQNDIKNFMESFRLNDAISRVIYTSHEPKGPYAVAEGVKLHYDDSDEQIASVRSHGIPVVDSKLHR